MKFSWKKSLLVICKILGLFVDTLTEDGKYSLFNMDSLRQTIQMQLSNKESRLLIFLLVFEIYIKFYSFWK